MREIKFRFFDGAKMCEVGDLTFFADNAGYHINGEFPSTGKDPYPLMQFTGLKDKNGKEIYEGDIFNCMYHRDGHIDHNYSVIFNEFSAAFEFQRHGPACPQRQVYQKVSDHAGWRGEVVGNIYENSDLLTK